MKKNIGIIFALLGFTLVSCNNKPADTATSTGFVKPTEQVTPSKETSKETTTEGPKKEIKDSLVFHYHRDDKKYDTWAMWLWKDGGEGAEYTLTSVDDYGAVFAVPLSTWFSTTPDAKIGFIVKSKGSWDKKDVDSDRFADLSNYTVDKDGNYNLYLWTGIGDIYDSIPKSIFRIGGAEFFDYRTIMLSSVGGNVASYKLYEDDNLIKEGTSKSDIVSISIDHDADLGKAYRVEVSDGKGHSGKADVSITRLYDTEKFSQTYDYEGDDLGAVYTKESTSFKVWSPFAKSIKLRIYASGTPMSVNASLGNDTFTDYDMTKGEKGVWSKVLEGDQEGKYYTYIVTNALYTEKEAVDPYAKSAGVNGLRGMIVDFSKTNPEGWDSFKKAYQYDRKSLTVYETHVVDITSSATWGGTAANAKKFLGLSETGTTYSEGDKSVKTGFDHIKELGVNAVQLQPIYDQTNDEVNTSFNWGYNPLNYNVLEGSYSSNPYDGYQRIKEFKQVVKDYHDAGINIIMDVVYNHVNAVNGENFDTLVPGYYFRYNGSTLSNGSGCGNETASNHTMFRKFMKDSTAFWAKEYKLGGFRFDLMGLHDIETMNQLTANLQAINPSICVYGEPWTGGTSALKSKAATQNNVGDYEGYGQFNDGIRDALIMSGMKGNDETGFVTSVSATNAGAYLPALLAGIRGRTQSNGLTDDPDKTVNYASCHDNFTLYDRFRAVEAATKATNLVSDIIYTEKQKEEMNVLANAIVMTSQGTSFMLAGEEMLRSKGEDLNVAHNSYNASYEVNTIDYSLLLKHPEMYQSYQKLIALKQNLDGLHLAVNEAKKEVVNINDGKNQISYELTDKTNNKTYKVIHNAGYGTLDDVDLAGYNLYLSTTDSEKTLSSSTKMNPYETVIAYKNIA